LENGYPIVDNLKIVKEVIDNFKSQGKTIIVIAHRLSTIANADTILVMENGKIIESNIIYKGNKRTGGVFKNEMLEIPEIKNLSNNKLINI
jgi:ABC-type bacteriocin/lantibiotic exporter with double-glycine peptidase domain